MMDEFEEDTGIIPTGMISMGEYVEELEGDIELSHTLILMLQERLEEAGLSPCVCGTCIADYRAEAGEEIQ